MIMMYTIYLNQSEIQLCHLTILNTGKICVVIISCSKISHLNIIQRAMVQILGEEIIFGYSLSRFKSHVMLKLLCKWYAIIVFIKWSKHYWKANRFSITKKLELDGNLPTITIINKIIVTTDNEYKYFSTTNLTER